VLRVCYLSNRRVRPMNPMTSMRPDESVDVGVHDYRAISKAVVFALVLSLAGVAALLSALFLVLPAFGLLSGLIGVFQIRRYPTELTGLKPGYFAVGLSGLLLVVGSGLPAYEYATEVPENAQRVAFWELQADDRPAQPRIPPTALQLDGQRIFIKGYVHPSVQKCGFVDG